jgi:hypothetical protein
MITNIRIELSDDERARVGAAVYGKPTPVTRKQVNEIVEILFDQLKGEQVMTAPPVIGEPPQTKSTAKPRYPNDPDYMRGWNAVGKAFKRRTR